MIQTAVGMLLDGMQGEDVISFLRERCKKLSTLNSTMSQVRTTLMRNGDNRSKDFDLSELAAFQEPGVQEFSDSSLEQQYKIQRDHKRNQSWSVGAEAALERVDLLPRGLGSFYLPRSDLVILKKKQEENQKKKNTDGVIIVPDSEKLLGNITEMLLTEENGIVSITLALLLCSGRRWIEIMKTGTFEAVIGSEYHCKFTGQAKRRGKGGWFVIPLLSPFKYFERGLQIMRKKLPHDMESYTNKEVSRKYQKVFFLHMKKYGFPGMPKCKVHDLRGAYCSLVYCLFECPNTLASTICQIAGHEMLSESLSYNHVKLQGVGDLEDTLGPLFPRKGAEEEEGNNEETEKTDMKVGGGGIDEDAAMALLEMRNLF